ncbi:MAG: PP2C family protein-serine/threonine phosphatase [Eubacterium sp.]|nr:PP2C family protein-serine/threonine phosphatase [Eubacterium sp.]
MDIYSINRKVQKNNRKILIQVGLAVTLILIIGISIIAMIFLYTNVRTFLMEKNRGISADLYAIKNNFYSDFNNQLFDIWREKPDEIKLYEEDEFPYPGLQNVYEVNEKKYEGFSEKEKVKFAQDYYNFNYALLSKYLEHLHMDYSNVFVMDMSEEHRGYIYCHYSNEGNHSKLGDYWEYDFKEHPAAKKILDGEKEAFELWDNPVNNKSYYVGYTAIDGDEDTHEIVLCLAYDWSEMKAKIFNNTLIFMVSLIIVSLIFAGGVILIFLRIQVLIPLTKVEGGLREYMEKKDSRYTVEKMAEIKSRNEMGVLADDISKLSQEMDRYVDENIKLAGERERVKAELDFAANIQNDMLIKDFDISDKVELYASMNPAKEVGGDFYDIFEIDEDHLGICIADVSGKGIPASLLMMSAMTAIRSFALSGSNPGKLLSQVNDDLVNRQISDMFVTIWIGILDLKTGILTTANAGHENPMINTTGCFEEYKDKHGFVAGGMEGMVYPEESIHLKTGDKVFVFTDGATEATNASQELYGVHRLLEAVNSGKDLSPEEIIGNVKEKIDEFVGEAEQFDDLTMLCFKYIG